MVLSVIVTLPDPVRRPPPWKPLAELPEMVVRSIVTESPPTAAPAPWLLPVIEQSDRFTTPCSKPTPKTSTPWFSLNVTLLNVAVQEEHSKPLTPAPLPEA